MFSESQCKRMDDARYGINGLLVLCLLAICCGPQAATAVTNSSAGPIHSAAEYFEPIISQRQFTDLVRPLDLPREQRMIVELVYEDYRDEIDRVMLRADREADEKGRQLVLDALAGRRVIVPDQLRRYRVSVLQVYRSLPSQALELIDRMIADVRSVLTREQRPILDKQIPTLRRMLFLHPRHLNKADYVYAGEGVDVVLLVREARDEGNELADVPAAALEPILDEYERDIDVLLQRTAASYRELMIDARVARIMQDRQAIRAAERELLDLWQELFVMNQACMERIRELAFTHAGEQAAQQWQQRFEQETFAWMYMPGQPDRIIDWMVRHEIDEERLEEATVVLEDFKHDRWQLHRESAEIMLRARFDLQIVVYAMMDPSELNGQSRSLYRDLLLNSGRLATVESRAIANLESLLDENELRQMRREVLRR